MTPPSGDFPLLAWTTRCGVPETAHIGTFAVSDGRKVIRSVGDPSLMTPLRSTGKPFQVSVLLENDRMVPLDFSAQELALMASSHNGEARHLDVLSRLLEKSSLSEEDLLCGTHAPYRPYVAMRQLTNNCSGKHAAMLIACQRLGYSTSNYNTPTHKLQTGIRRELLRSYFRDLTPGLDGCGVPTWAVSVADLAHAYARFAVSESTGAVSLRNAYLQEPFYMAGTDRIETYLTGTFGFVAKSGSDGVWAAAVPEYGLGIAVKVLSGSENVAAILTIQILRELSVILARYDSEIERLLEWSVKTCSGEAAGELVLDTMKGFGHDHNRP